MAGETLAVTQYPQGVKETHEQGRWKLTKEEIDTHEGQGMVDDGARTHEAAKIDLSAR